MRPMMWPVSVPQRRGLCRAFIAALCLAAMECVATTAHVDVLSHLQRERIARLGAADALAHSNAAFVRQMLVEPASPYSDLIAEPAFTNDVEWAGLLERIPGGPLTSHQALAVMQWDLGMTRARPGIDIDIKPGYRDDFASASATKADVDPDIFWHVLDLTGYSHSTKGAGYAVGLQILRRQLAETPEERRVALNVDPDVFGRIMQARHFDEVTEYDLGYVSALVQQRLVHWRVGGKASHGLRALPVAYRIARVAAAYRDLEGYHAGYPCDRAANAIAGTAGTGAAGDDRPLCFAAATDRAVHRWYLGEYLRQSRVVPHHESGLAHFARLAGAILALVDIAGALEVVEALIADDLVAAETITSAEAEFAAERADVLSCRIPD
ncbi:hypothetical protein J2T07_003248 [Luteibacter jiangsuensis]|uniref:Uncharacterized protein n=1 Tax=Luteibacter jiangsuensis TaxID=637577 RepID=A0ABT9T1C0_9GAMM|nr:hypothetical protein [Luteibacter jiangsuensis]MDQ0011042.1 hypothetical protein [Luteibacter jiangsuensis]